MLLEQRIEKIRMLSCEIDEQCETEVPKNDDRPWALVVAGGDGRRLRALTERIAGAPVPKRYCRIAGDRTMLESTLARIADSRGSFAPDSSLHGVTNTGRPR